MPRPFRLVAPEPYEIDIYESCASAVATLLLPPAMWACYPAGALQLTPQGRLLLVERITEAGWSVVQAAQAAGISVRQSYVGWRVIALRGRQVWLTAARRRTAASTVLLAIVSTKSSGCGGSG